MSISLGEKVRAEKQKLQNVPHDTLCLSFSCNLIGYFKQALREWVSVRAVRSILLETRISLVSRVL